MATPTKQELDQINALLNDVQKKYDQLGRSNPFRNFDQKNIVDAGSAIKQLEVSLKGVNTELNNTNDEFSNTFKSLQSIVNELTRGKVATNKITNSTRTLEDVSSKILAQKNKGIKLDSKELMSMQKKADISFTNLKQQRSQIEALKEEADYSLKVSKSKIQEIGTAKNLTAEKKKERAAAEKSQTQALNDLAEHETRLGNINSILDKSSNFQDVIDKGLKREILDRKAIEGSIGITGGLLTSLSKVTGITGVFDIDKIKAEAEKIAEDAIDQFRQVKEYIRDEEAFNVNIDNAKTSLLEISNVALLTQQEVIELKDELKTLQDKEVNFKFSLDPEFDKAAKAKIENDIAEVQELIELGTEGSRKIRVDKLEGDLEKAQKGLEGLESAARNASNSMSSQFKKLGKTLGLTFEGLANSIKSPEAIFTALIAIAGEVNGQVVDLSKSMNVSYDEAQNVREEFAQITLASGETVINTQRLVEAQMQFNEALGLTGKIIPENAASQSKLTNQLGIGVDSATKLRQIAESTGEDFREQTLAQYETVSALSAQKGVAINVKGVMDEVGKAGAYGLAQFQGSVVALTEGVAQAKALGLSLDQVNSIAGKLMDFESSINAELQAELLLGKDINLEKARLAALNNDQKTLMEEINREMGTFEDFSKMNRIQQEAMADAIGMSVDGLSESLLMQQYGEMNQAEIVALKGEEVAKQVEMVKSQEAFQNMILAMKGTLADIAAGPLGDMANLVTSLLSNSTAMYGIMGALAIGPLTSIGKSLKSAYGFSKAMLASQKSQLIIETAMGAKAKISAAFAAARTAAINPLLGVAAVAGAVLAYKGIQALTMDDGIIPGQGKVVSTPKDKIAFKSGYGKRVLSSPEGKIAFNDKDTIVAGTNLEQNMTTNNNGQSIQNSVTTNQPTQNSVINRPTTNSMVSNNQNTTQPIAPVSNAMMEGELKAIKRVLENIATKEGTVSMNGTKFGTVTAMNTYQIQ
mgnify:CR=1 FL=1